MLLVQTLTKCTISRHFHALPSFIFPSFSRLLRSPLVHAVIQ
jgi:hypothetical protein